VVDLFRRDNPPPLRLRHWQVLQCSVPQQLLDLARMQLRSAAGHCSYSICVTVFYSGRSCGNR